MAAQRSKPRSVSTPKVLKHAGASLDRASSSYVAAAKAIVKNGPTARMCDLVDYTSLAIRVEPPATDWQACARVGEIMAKADDRSGVAFRLHNMLMRHSARQALAPNSPSHPSHLHH